MEQVSAQYQTLKHFAMWINKNLYFNNKVYSKRFIHQAQEVMTTKLELAEQEANDFTTMNQQGKRRARKMENQVRNNEKVGKLS